MVVAERVAAVLEAEATAAAAAEAAATVVVATAAKEKAVTEAAEVAGLGLQPEGSVAEEATASWEVAPLEVAD